MAKITAEIKMNKIGNALLWIRAIAKVAGFVKVERRVAKEMSENPRRYIMIIVK